MKPVTYTNQGQAGVEHSAVSFRQIDDPEEPAAVVELMMMSKGTAGEPAVEMLWCDDAYDVVLDREQALHLYRWLGVVLGRSAVISQKIIEG